MNVEEEYIEIQRQNDAHARLPAAITSWGDRFLDKFTGIIARFLQQGLFLLRIPTIDVFYLDRLAEDRPGKRLPPNLPVERERT